MGTQQVETHFLIDCEFYSDLRYGLLNYAACIDTSFCHNDSLDKCIFNELRNSTIQTDLSSKQNDKKFLSCVEH